MSNHPRPLLLGYIRADVLADGIGLCTVEAQLGAFADREEFALGTIYVEKGDPPGAFHALLDEASRSESTPSVVVPDLRHVTLTEHLVMSRHLDFDRSRILVAGFTLVAGRAGAVSPVQRQVCRSIHPE
jgi:hypothetical protein